MEVLKSGKSGEQRLRLHYLDGLRGLASLYVVMYHLSGYMGQVPIFLQLIGKTLNYGTFAVVIFIVLSGYVLMLPVTRSQSVYLSEGLWNYIQRRVRRILPPYYAALVFTLLVAVIILGLIKFFNFQWYQLPEVEDGFNPFFSPIDVITHLLLVQNFTSDTIESIDAPMWSIAIEWQIYFIFPLFLLPIWRRFGIFSTLFYTFLISLLPFYLWNELMEPVHPWFIGLFALGMAAADVGFSQQPKLVAMRESLPWSVFVIIFFLMTLIINQEIERWIYHYICGLAAACLLIYCTKCVVEGKKSLILRLFETRWAIALGAFSYSLYLTHAVIITVVEHLLSNLQMPPVKFILVLYVVALPLSLIIAYLFYLIFERPFMSNFLKKRKVKDAVN
ncbi:acyltransferase [Nostoc sp. ChiQUE01b]|uniref:acyltransferase family protein n=1 Tax=Nostoc sp. ChiQUE01b TaxID=3075376 RepID=UPI002AD3A1D5|nr:acyltransferase [Nostoc sp. ChiQUE01b]MDZ8257263.1 acyltransferase [Nostoc sp. ChiQUE01b]